jgi:hypothetical protein
MLDQATPGNWQIWSDFDDSTWTIGPAGGISVADLIGNHTDARLIAAAPDLAQRVIDQEAAIRRVRDIHEGIDALMNPGPHERLVKVCSGCGTDDGNWQRWPCPTIRALDGGEQG